MAEKQAVVVRVGTEPGEEPLRELLRQRQEDRAALDALEAEVKEINGTVLDAVYEWKGLYPEADAFDFGVDEQTGTLRIREVVRPGQRKISPQKLLELGVKPETIEAAWEVGEPSAPFLEVRRVKDV